MGSTEAPPLETHSDPLPTPATHFQSTVIYSPVVTISKTLIKDSARKRSSELDSHSAVPAQCVHESLEVSTPGTVDLSSVSEDKPTLGDLLSSLELVLCEVLHGRSLFPLAGVRAPQATQDQRQDCEGCLLIPTRAQPAVLGSPSSPVPTPGETTAEH